jgi:hypothetical protein
VSVNGGYYFNNGGYFRNTDSMQRVTDNERVGPDDFDQFCVTAPTDPRLPNGGGYEICGLSAIKPSAFGLSQPVVKRTGNFGQDIRRNHFFGVGLNARLPGGIRIGGGFDAGYISRDQCFDVDSRGLTTFSVAGSVIPGVFGGQTATTIDGQQTCKATMPFRGLAMLKLNGSVPIKGGFTASAIFQDQAGAPVDAVWSAPNSVIAPRLGRNLAGNTAFQNVPLVRAGELFEDRIRRLDLRLSKSFPLPRRLNLQLNLDAYNALNASPAQAVNTVFGANWRQPLNVLDPRILQISGMLSF